MSCEMRVVSCAAVLLAGAAIGLAGAGSAVAAVDCSQIAKRGIEKQTNLHASALLVACGKAEGGGPAGGGTRGQAPSALAIGGSDINLITGGEVFPHVTQSESFVWGHGDTVVVKYNDSRTAPDNYSGVSVSTNGGATFTRLLPSPFATGHGDNFGDPTVVYNAKLGKWFASDLATGCGGQGIGIWESTVPASSWTPGACAHSGFGDDRQSMWVDNNPASPHYGRIYISWNDFDRGGALVVTYSDTGTTWSAPVTLNGGFIRDVQLTGSPGTDGTVFVAAMDEGGGGFNSRQNLVYRSTDGGVTWTEIILGSRFAAAGDSVCDNPYFARIDPIWRHMGWGQPAAGPGGVVAYNYTVHGPGSDPGDIYLTRSTDNGLTWSAPVRLNTDSSGKAQWMPSLLITPAGVVLATWYDRRNTTDGLNYQRFGRISTDNGATWGPEMPISDVLIPQPVQPDPFVQACYAGDYNYITANGDTGYDAWTDGRVAISGLPQQDVFFDKVALPQNRPPVCSGVRSDRTRLWPPDHSVQLVTLSGATDPDGDPLRLDITGVTQDEPVDGTGDGDTSPDAKRGATPNQVFLRAERSGKGDGRVYRVAFSVSDGKGGTCTGTVTVGVPRDQRAGANPVDSGQTFNSFG